jgi:hypothetical protein
VTERKLNGTQIPGAAVDQRRFGSLQRVRSQPVATLEIFSTMLRGSLPLAPASKYHVGGGINEMHMIKIRA